VFLVNSRFPLDSATLSSSGRWVLHPTGVLLLPKLRRHFAEFLNHSSPDRLGILYPPTCVGLGYGHRASSLEAFLGSMGSVTSPESARHRVSGCVGTGFAWAPPYTLTPGQPTPGFTYPPASPRCLPRQGGSVRPPEGEQPLSNPGPAGARTRWYRNINRLCIDYAFRPRLSSRLTLGGLAFPRNPWAFGGGVSHPSLATHANILTRSRSTSVLTAASLRDRRSPTTPCKSRKSAASAPGLSPVTLSARDHSTSELLRTLSRVAASKPTSWLSSQSHIVFHLAWN
jgi:hypothetical protein